MKFIRLTKLFSTIVISALLFTACGIESDQNPASTAGKTAVIISGGGNPATLKKSIIPYNNIPTTIQVVEIRRLINNPSDLNKTLTIKIQDDSSIVSQLNPAYKILPAAFYTVATQTPKVNGYYTIELLPGDTAKSISITIPNAAQFSPLTRYALGFTITYAGNSGYISEERSIVVEVVAINSWDGVYMNIGNPAMPDRGFRDVTNTAFTSIGSQQYSLITIDATTCLVIPDTLGLGMPKYFFSNNGTVASYGSYGLVIRFDPANNTVKEIFNFYGSRSLTGWWAPDYDWNFFCMTDFPLYASCNSRRAILDPTGVNSVQPNKDISIKHFMLQSSIFPPPSIRCYFDETWKYLRPR